MDSNIKNLQTEFFPGYLTLLECRIYRQLHMTRTGAKGNEKVQNCRITWNSVYFPQTILNTEPLDWQSSKLFEFNI